jgi:hypothetical protein
MAEKNKNLIEVRSNYPVKRDGGSQIALNETDPRHPNGQAFVGSPLSFVKVYKTAKVSELLTKKVLIQKGSDEDTENPVVDMRRKVANAEGEVPTETETETVAAVELREGDDPDKLAERYDRAVLAKHATENKIEFGARDSAKTIAEKILSAA